MRTTITLDDDVAAMLKQLQRTSKRSLKDVINEALREGLARLERPTKPRAPYVVQALSVGSCLLGNLDDVAEVLAVAEGEAFQ